MPVTDDGTSAVSSVGIVTTLVITVLLAMIALSWYQSL